MKIIVCGDVKGKFRLLSKKLFSIISKTGACEMAFCVGEFFGEKATYDELLTGCIKFPLQTYVLGTCSQEAASYIGKADERMDLCTNLTYLGRSGLFTTHSKLKIFYVSGTENEKAGPVHFGGEVLDKVRSISATASFKGVDILLTCQWPALIDKYATKIDYPYKGSKVLSQVASLLKPRYHYCAYEDLNYERLPYRNHVVLAEKSQHTTRFIALASFGNAKKEKFIYAFNMEPMELMEASELVKQPDHTTVSPYHGMQLETPPDELHQQFFYQEKKKRPQGASGGAAKRFRPSDINPDSCWFCLANVKVEKHMVVTIGNQCYLALAKGGLTDDHVLIVPINHFQSSVTLDQEVLQEIDTYKKHLRDFFSKRDKVVVFFERNYKSAHLQLQAVPLSASLQSSLHHSILQCASLNGVTLVELPERSDLRQIVNPPKSAFFTLELPDGKKLFTQVSTGFPLQFGRMLLCQEAVLNEPSKEDWKKCQVPADQETRLCQAFRKLFEPFNPFD